MAKKYFLLILTLLFAGFLFFYKLDKVPAGLNNDEVSESYNAYSLLKTGADRYGMVLPLQFRSLGSFLLPAYTYLTAGVFLIFGVTAVGVTIPSILSGLVIILITFLIFKNNDGPKSFPFSIALVFILSFSPWLVLFSRSTTDVALGLAIFLAGFYFLMRSLSKPLNFIVGSFLLGLSSWAYYFERFAIFIFLPIFILVFRKKLLKYKKVLIVGVGVFLLTQIPNLFLLKVGGLFRRFDQVSYFSYVDFVKNGGGLRSLPLGQVLYITREFLSHYVSYFSPRSLFFSPDDQTVRSMPGLSVFYNWMIVPFVVGLYAFLKERKTDLGRIIFILTLISLIPAALTVEPFYTNRVLLFLWIMTIIIVRGIMKFPRVLLIILFIYSLFSLYKSYFVLFRYEREAEFGHQYIELVNIVRKNPSETFVIDNSRDSSICIRFALSMLYDPSQFQKNIGRRFLDSYYSNYQVGEDCSINNAEVRLIDWGKDVDPNKILVGDPLAISQAQVGEHGLVPKFEIKNSSNELVLIGYAKQSLKK